MTDAELVTTFGTPHEHDWYVCNGRCLNDDCNWRICERCGQTEGAE